MSIDIDLPFLKHDFIIEGALVYLFFYHVIMYVQNETRHDSCILFFVSGKFNFEPIFGKQLE